MTDARRPVADDTTGYRPDPDELAVHLSEVAQTLHQQHSTQGTLDEIVRSAVETIPGAHDAAITTVLAKREVRTVSMSGELSAKVDQAQYDTGQGPCLDALYEHKTTSMPDVNHETRWPRFTERARRLGVSSMLSFQLFVRDDDLGALNLYSPDTEAFDEESEHVGLLFASHAAVALAAAQQREHLTEAMRTRDLIGQAKGILMERHKLTGDQAFTLLVRASQRANIKLRDLADELVHTGRLARSPAGSRGRAAGL
ncbi:GAF and ANTAR domain-containing protein [Saccharothrix deserti]|uniref:GAF and ANTAR domain-containing protein n=1 Tax=Saccharothrix deserti TaxID=2593674 RepID=UPI00192E6781|nr:GAF and ANTAR domain-containing protein [Saccharothrix deserti]